MKPKTMKLLKENPFDLELGEDFSGYDTPKASSVSEQTDKMDLFKIKHCAFYGNVEIMKRKYERK